MWLMKVGEGAPTSSSERHGGASPTRAVAAVMLAHVTVDGSLGLLAVLLPDLQERFAFSNTALAGLVALLAFSSSVAQPLFGHLADRTGVRRAATAGVVLAAALVLLAVARHPLIAVAAVAVGGLGASAFHPAATTLVGRATTSSATVIGIFSAAGMLGLAAVPLVVLQILRLGGRPFLPALFIPAALAAWWLWRANAGQDVGRRRTATDDSSPSTTSWSDLFRGPVAALTLAATLSNVAWHTYAGGTPLVIAESLGSTRSPWIGWTLAVFNVSAALGGVIAGWYASRHGRSTAIVGSLLLALPALLWSLVLAPASLAALLAAAVAGAGLHASLPILVVAAQDMSPENPSTAAGMIFGLAVGAGGVLYLPIGWLQPQIGIHAASAIAYLLVLPAAFLAARTVSRSPLRGGEQADNVPLLCRCGHPYPADAPTC